MFFYLVDLTPTNAFAKLDLNSEVIVAPKVRKIADNVSVPLDDVITEEAYAPLRIIPLEIISSHNCEPSTVMVSSQRTFVQKNGETFDLEEGEFVFVSAPQIIKSSVGDEIEEDKKDNASASLSKGGKISENLKGMFLRVKWNKLVPYNHAVVTEVDKNSLGANLFSTIRYIFVLYGS